MTSSLQIRKESKEPMLNSYRQRGFNLIELMIVLVIIGVFMSLAAPAYRAAINNSAREEAAISFVNALALARSEAVARGTRVMVAPNGAADNPVGTGAYSGGVWSVLLQNLSPAFAGDPSPVIETYQVSQVDSVSTAALPDLDSQFIFSPNGTLNQTASVNFCFDSGGACSQVRINLVGRAQIAVVEQP